MILRTAIALLLATSCGADDNLTIKTGVGLSNSSGSAVYAVGYEALTEGNFVLKGEFGGWTDGAIDRKGSPFGSALIGKRFGSLDGLNVQGLAGVVSVGYTDNLLSTNFQFTEEVSLGFKQLSVGYKHISNANIKKPNVGRDFLFVSFAIPWMF